MISGRSCFVLSVTQILPRIGEPNGVLEQRVNDGASISLMLPFNHGKSEPFWIKATQSISRGGRIILSTQDVWGMLVGAVQLIIDRPENQPHRADIAKLLARPSMRRGSLAHGLINELESCVRQQGKTLLVFDTMIGSDTELFYHNCGWKKMGVIPDYARAPDGMLTGTAFLYKTLQFIAGD